MIQTIKQKKVPEVESLSLFQRMRQDWRAFRKKISYKKMLGAIPYISFLALLAVIYIANNHHAVEVQRELNKRQKELKQLRWRDMDTKTRLMNAGMETKIIQSAQPLGLEPLTLPAYSISVKD